jgi:hypothetical protein
MVVHGHDGIVRHAILLTMSNRQEGDEEQQRDALLRHLLRTPPEPRPQRERDDEEPTQKGRAPTSEGTPEPSA